jgi:hypothetical protein
MQEQVQTMAAVTREARGGAGLSIEKAALRRLSLPAEAEAVARRER